MTRLITMLALVFVASVASATPLKLPYLPNPEENYELGLLKLALSYSEEPYQFSFAAEEQNDESRIAEIERGGLDLFWAATNQDLERRLLPVRIPLYKGLLGHRLLVIRQQDAARFAPIRTLEELARLNEVTVRQLERLFHKYLQRTPSQYYLELRLSRARELLLRSDVQVREVALACGFSSPAHFSKSYSRFFGLSPLGERRQASLH